MTLNLFHIVLGFICNGIEIVMFFLAVRMILLFKTIRWLQAFDEAGKTLVDGVTRIVDRNAHRFWKNRLTTKSLLAIAFVLLNLCRIILIQTCHYI